MHVRRSGIVWDNNSVGLNFRQDETIWPTVEQWTGYRFHAVCKKKAFQIVASYSLLAY